MSFGISPSRNVDTLSWKYFAKASHSSLASMFVGNTAEPVFMFPVRSSIIEKRPYVSDCSIWE